LRIYAEAIGASLYHHRDESGREKALAPAFLCVVCGITGYTFMRKDGVMVAPITELKP
jgi:hypothetical protein